MRNRYARVAAAGGVLIAASGCVFFPAVLDPLTEFRSDLLFAQRNCVGGDCDRDEWVELALSGGLRRSITWPLLEEQPAGLAWLGDEIRSGLSGDVRPADLLTVVVDSRGILFLVPIGSVAPTAQIPIEDSVVTFGAAWSNDGTRLALVRGRYAAAETVLQVRDEALGILAEFPLPFATQYQAPAAAISWSADDELVAVSTPLLGSGQSISDAAIIELATGWTTSVPVMSAVFIGERQLVASPIGAQSYAVVYDVGAAGVAPVGRVNGIQAVLDADPASGVFLTLEEGFGYYAEPRALRTVGEGPDRVHIDNSDHVGAAGNAVLLRRSDVERVLGPLKLLNP